MDALWDLVIGCMRCREEDPVEAWSEYIRRTRLRKEELDRGEYTLYRFESAGTDLTVEPARGVRWMGGCNEFPGATGFHSESADRRGILHSSPAESERPCDVHASPELRRRDDRRLHSLAGRGTHREV